MSAAAPAPPPAAAAKPPLTTWPMVGIAGVMLGSIISTLSGRLTSFGLADIRGAIHATSDEGAWITTAFNVGQMMMGPLTIWLGAVFGPRRVLLWSAAIFTLLSIVVPFCTDLPTFIFLYLLGGLSSGTFIPLTVSFVLRNLKPQFAVYGISAYAMNSELSQNISASIEGWFVDNWSWHWIFWQNAFVTPAMMVCIYFGIPREPANHALLWSKRWSGLLLACIGFSMLHVALDQGERLDWLNSGLIVGMLAGGALLVAAFLIAELRSKDPCINLSYISTGNMPSLAVILIMFRFAVLSTALLIPQYMTSVHGFRALQTGDVLLWIAAPQFLLAPLIGFALQHVDPRLPLAIGLALVGIACYMTASVTADWASGDFLLSQIVQAVGQTFAFTSLIWLFAKHIRLPDVFTFGAFVHTVRLLGGALGVAFMQTFLRVREHTHVNLLGTHVSSGSYATDSRLADYVAAVTSDVDSAADAQSVALSLISRAVRTQAQVLSYIDGFTVIGLSLAACLLLVASLKTPDSMKK